MTDAARIPASYASSRAHFLGAAAAAGAEVSSHPIDARGPGGEALFAILLSGVESKVLNDHDSTGLQIASDGLDVFTNDAVRKDDLGVE